MNEKLLADGLRNDPRVAQAKQLLNDALKEHQSKISTTRGPIDSLRTNYQASLEALQTMRGGNLYYPYLSSGLGKGPYVELADGSVKLDLISGIGVHGLGHSHPALMNIGVDAILSDTIMQGNLQQGGETSELIELLLSTANQTGANLAHCTLSTSGAMANENAMKLAFQNRQPANRLLAFKDCFAGRTIALSQVTDRPAYRQGVPESINVDFVPFYDAQRHDESIAETVAAVESHLLRFPGKHAAFWFELIQGEGGYYPGCTEFFQAIIAVLRKHDVLVVFDEIQTFARTTHPFAFQLFGLEDEADIVTIGKITQVCATLYQTDFKPKPGLISQTFTGGTWEILAATTIVKTLNDQGNFGDAGINQQLHDHFVSGLMKIGDTYPGSVTGPFGIGGMIAFTPYEGTAARAKQVCQRLFEEGLIGFVTGSNPARVRFLLPIGVVQTSDIDLACEILARVLGEMQKESS